MYFLSAVFPYSAAISLKQWFSVLATHWGHPGPTSDQFNQNLWPWNPDISMFLKLFRRFQRSAMTENYHSTGCFFLTGSCLKALRSDSTSSNLWFRSMSHVSNLWDSL